MSSQKDLESKGNKGILTRQTTQNHPELKKQVDEINKEAKSTKLTSANTVK